jgi:hypothetical protein
MKSYDLNGKLPANLFDPKLFKKGDRVERMYMHLVQPRRYQLKPDEQTYLNMCTQAFGIICDNPSRREARRLIKEQVLEEVRAERGDPHYASVIQVMRDAEALYGRFEQINRRIQRGIIRERISVRLQQLYREAAEGEADDKAIGKYEELLIKLDKLDEIIDEEGIDTTIPALEFTQDPTALLEAEDIEYEEE